VTRDELRPLALPLAATLAGVALAAPSWVGRFVPLVDLPQHLAVVAVLRHHADPEWGFAPFFETQWGELTPYWTYYLATYLLSLVAPLETASRLYLSLYALAFPWAGILLCRAFGRSAWLGLLAAPLALNTNFYLGFVSYSTAVVIGLWLLADFETLPERGATRRALHAAAAAVLFFTHVQVFVFVVGGAGFLAATRPSTTWGGRLRRAALLAPAVLGLFVPWLYQQIFAPREAVTGQYTFGRAGRMGAMFQSPVTALRDLPDAVAGSFQDGSDRALFALWVLVMAWAWRASPGRRLRRGAASSRSPGSPSPPISWRRSPSPDNGTSGRGSRCWRRSS
jgi:hypothetical protein